jgi:hypothetical protein
MGTVRVGIEREQSPATLERPIFTARSPSPLPHQFKKPPKPLMRLTAALRFTFAIPPLQLSSKTASMKDEL